MQYWQSATGNRLVSAFSIRRSPGSSLLDINVEFRVHDTKFARKLKIYQILPIVDWNVPSINRQCIFYVFPILLYRKYILIDNGLYIVKSIRENEYILCLCVRKERRFRRVSIIYIYRTPCGLSQCPSVGVGVCGPRKDIFHAGWKKQIWPFSHQGTCADTGGEARICFFFTPSSLPFPFLLREQKPNLYMYLYTRYMYMRALLWFIVNSLDGELLGYVLMMH